VNSWDPVRARAAVHDLRRRSDLVVVGLHGGVEYLTRPDPVLAHVTELLTGWGADVVWGHGAHVTYPVSVHPGDGRPAVVAPGLGNALFDQRMPRTRTGAVLEVLADPDGVIALRTGRIAIDSGRSSFAGWDQPLGDAVALDGEWWTPVRPWVAVESAAATVPAAAGLPPDSLLVTVATGSITGVGSHETVVAYRRPMTAHPGHQAFPGVVWADPRGRSAHLAVFTDTGRMRWGSALMFQPVGAVAACDGAMALGFTDLADPAFDDREPARSRVTGGGAWVWDGFGFRTATVLPGPASPACADVDHDGATDPILTGRVPPAATAD
jgi:hypothetical protein